MPEATALTDLGVGQRVSRIQKGWLLMTDSICLFVCLGVASPFPKARCVAANPFCLLQIRCHAHPDVIADRPCSRHCRRWRHLARGGGRAARALVRCAAEGAA